MKKLFALLLALCLVLSVGAAVAEENQGLKDARSYINLMYKNKPQSTPKDYELVGSVPSDGEPYIVEWTTDSDTIVITREENGMVKVDVDEDNTKEVHYVLTATVTDGTDSLSISFDRGSRLHAGRPGQAARRHRAARQGRGHPLCLQRAVRQHHRQHPGGRAG